MLVAGRRGAVWREPDGTAEAISLSSAARRLRDDARVLVCHGRGTASRLGIETIPDFDVLELFAFARPARFCLPTPASVAEALGLPLPTGPEAEAEAIEKAASALLEELANAPSKDAEAVAWAMGQGGWAWAPRVLAALDVPGDGGAGRTDPVRALAVWHRLQEWEDEGPPPPPDAWPVEPVEARAQLTSLLGRHSEARPQQKQYASDVSRAFLPRDDAGAPNVVLAEAGTGVGKTLGYIAPASLWAQKNGGTVWISTFTRNLQRQLDGELSRLYPDPEIKAERVVIRKGRENYLCLLNFEEALGRTRARGGRALIALGLVARWARASRDGDMIGGDFPAWLGDLFGVGLTRDLTDTRGECIYSACSHYRKCFIEHSQRRAKQAKIVVANHALVMVQAALGGHAMGDAGDTRLPQRYVFDEGHHLFNAADSAFSSHLSGQETADLRRWLVGAEDRSTGARSKGLRRRLEDLIADDADLSGALDAALFAAQALAGPGWRGRLAEGTPKGTAEAFLAEVRRQVFARSESAHSPYGLEVVPHPASPELLDAAAKLKTSLGRLGQPLSELIERLQAKLDQDADELDTATRNRIDAVTGTIERRGLRQIAAWRGMLEALETETPELFVDWLAVERTGGRELDVGLYRHFIDPTEPLADALLENAHGLLVTSATLRDAAGDAKGADLERADWDGPDWDWADRRTGIKHMISETLEPPAKLHRSAVSSPFDYPAQTRILVVGDVKRDDPDQVAAAYRELFQAAGGGALGLFTAISRLRDVHERLIGPLDQAGLKLLAQHVDAMDTGTLIDIFRAEEHTCLLGTDAVRDGVDVPGAALRLIVFDRVPWPRPDILHRARRDAFGGREYDERLTRLKLKQAYGRLIRRAGDKGVFVMLDRAFPSRLATAFPEGVTPERLGLKEAIAEVGRFLSTADPEPARPDRGLADEKSEKP